MSKRRKYSLKYKREAVQLLKGSGVTIAQVARELGINANMLSRYCLCTARLEEKAGNLKQANVWC